MKPLLWTYEFVFGCHHKQLTRVFSIQGRTYQVCVECGREFRYSWELMDSRPLSVSDDVYALVNLVNATEGSTSSSYRAGIAA
jgi:hypothetical protein